MNKLFSPSKKTTELMLSEAAELLSVSVDKLYTHPDYVFVDHPKVLDDLSVMLDKIALLPIKADYIVVVIDGIDTLSSQGQNKLLKPLEDYKHCIFLVSDSGEGAILPTIKSRLIFQEVSETTDKTSIEGCIGSYIPSEECITVFKNVVSALDNNKSIRKPLNLVVNKDSNNFFTLYGVAGVKALYSLLSAVLVAYLMKGYGVDDIKSPSNLSGHYKQISLKKMLTSISESTNKVQTKGYAYTAAEFFRDIINFELASVREMEV